MRDPWALLGAGAADEGFIENRRRLSLFGLSFELCLIPSRGGRAGVPSTEAPAFAVHPADRIRSEEALWRGDGLVLTPNRYPFFAPQLLAWPEAASPREADRDFLERCFRLADAAGASLLFNTVGASASIPLAHAHVLAAQSTVLAEIPLVRVGVGDGFSCWSPDPGGPAPFFAAVIEAVDPGLRAREVRRLADCRRTAAVNLISVGTKVWVVPRRQEVPAPEFPYAIGAGELFGRFVFPKPDEFGAATQPALEAAMTKATVRCGAQQIASLRRVWDF